jgi:hypothetical protein
MVTDAIERMGEALFHLSDQLRGSDWLANEAHHQTYEIVVQEWTVLTEALAMNGDVVEATVRAAFCEGFMHGHEAGEFGRSSTTWVVDWTDSKAFASLLGSRPAKRPRPVVARGVGATRDGAI